MKKFKWNQFDLRELESKTEQERFDIFYKLIHDESGSIMFAGNLLQRAATLIPDNIALIYEDREMSYKELYHRACLFGQALRECGVKPRDRVLIFFRNSLEFYIAYFAVWQLGAVVAPLNIFLSDRALQHIVNDAQAAAVVTTSEKEEFFAQAGASNILTEQDMDFDAPLVGESFDCAIEQLGADELAALLYTSGTTGLPKGVMLSSKNIMTNVVQIMARIPLSEAQRMFCVLPLFHSFAQNTCVWSSFFSGCAVIVVPKIDRRALFKGLEHKPTIFLGVPALYGLLCMLKTAPISDVQYFISGGDALPDKISGAFELIYRRKLCNGYGLTETSPLISVDLEDVSEPTNNIGRPALGVQCSIRDEHGHELQKGEIGQLWVKGDNVMMGYYNAPERTAQVLKDGWFCTGDLAKLDENGKLLICGREKDLIIHKGMNIYPQEIENVILGHMGVMFAGVIGQQEEMHGELPIAFVQLCPGQKEEGMEKELRVLCKKNLAAYKVPRAFFFVKDMPLTATKKVDKKVLRVRLAPTKTKS